MSGAHLLVLLVSNAAFADLAPATTPPPANCQGRQVLSSGVVEDGHYVALEPMPGFDGTGEKGSKWFHQVVITISGGSATTEEMPLVYVHGTRHESASDARSSRLRHAATTSQ